MTSQADPSPDRPTTDQLAGVYVYIEAEEKVLLPSRDSNKKAETAREFQRPTTDQLAGVYVCIEADEKLTPPSPEQLPRP
jgi:hypothetical protein